MKKVFSLAVLFLVSLLVLVSFVSSRANIEAEEQIIYWGVPIDTNLFGYYNIANGEIEGFDVDIAKAITHELTGDEANAKFVEVNSKSRVPMLKNGNIDAIIATMSITEERKKVVHFSDVYFNAGQTLLVPEDSTITSLDDLGPNDVVLAVKGTILADSLRKIKPDANIIELENYAEAFTALESNQGVAMTAEDVILMGILAQQPGGYKLVGENFTEEPYGIAVNHGQEEFLEAINQALIRIHENGTYEQIYAKWIP